MLLDTLRPMSEVAAVSVPLGEVVTTPWFIDPSRFDGSRDGRSCTVDYRAEIVPLHRFDLPNAPVTAWKVRILGGGRNALGENNFIEWYGQRHGVRADAVAELESLTGEAS